MERKPRKRMNTEKEQDKGREGEKERKKNYVALLDKNSRRRK